MGNDGINGKIFKVGFKFVKYNGYGQISMIGDKSVEYLPNGQISKIGDNDVEYFLNGNIFVIGDKFVEYHRNGQISKIGYDFVEYEAVSNETVPNKKKGEIKTDLTINERNSLLRSMKAEKLANINKLLFYLYRQYKRVDPNTTKHDKLKSIHDRLESARVNPGDVDLQSYVNETINVTYEHTETGLVGFFKFNWLRDTKSYKELGNIIKLDSPYKSFK